jgi:hypothetical protein
LDRSEIVDCGGVRRKNIIDYHVLKNKAHLGRIPPLNKTKSRVDTLSDYSVQFSIIIHKTCGILDYPSPI